MFNNMSQNNCYVYNMCQNNCYVYNMSQNNCYVYNMSQTYCFVYNMSQNNCYVYNISQNYCFVYNRNQITLFITLYHTEVKFLLLKVDVKWTSLECSYIFIIGLYGCRQYFYEEKTPIASELKTIIQISLLTVYIFDVSVSGLVLGVSEIILYIFI